MPRFTVSDREIAELVAFIQTQKTLAESQKGGRRGVDYRRSSNWRCRRPVSCISMGRGSARRVTRPTGDLAGVAKRFEGLKLEQRFLYPRDVKARIVSPLLSGERCRDTGL